MEAYRRESKLYKAIIPESFLGTDHTLGRVNFRFSNSRYPLLKLDGLSFPFTVDGTALIEKGNSLAGSGRLTLNKDEAYLYVERDYDQNIDQRKAVKEYFDMAAKAFMKLWNEGAVLFEKRELKPIYHSKWFPSDFLSEFKGEDIYWAGGELIWLVTPGKPPKTQSLSRNERVGTNIIRRRAGRTPSHHGE